MFNVRIFCRSRFLSPGIQGTLRPRATCGRLSTREFAARAKSEIGGELSASGPLPRVATRFKRTQCFNPHPPFQFPAPRGAFRWVAETIFCSIHLTESDVS
jgi:hypothetical protein